MFTSNGLIAMYGNCSGLLEAWQILDEMPNRDVVSWKSMVAGHAQNARFDDALKVCKEMKVLEQKPDADTMASLMPAVTNTSSDIVSNVKGLFMKSDKKSLMSWNVRLAAFMKNSNAWRRSC
ncbi:Pentatricopeptide repeat-containing protein [Quillaja saponaria]|uniref:Pentatricopeptide repeat-containing protein n=1 Tax=Quillaja saponaria TaxID=32244 RepID=A0AAD7M4K0_QUISA|nr:Pentatricopeptide repeat-containing protein [Quillaja saponaria]